MQTQKSFLKNRRSKNVLPRDLHPVAVAAGTVSGATAGAAIGAIGGPPGVIAGAIIGGIVGAATGTALDYGREARLQHDEELDRDIGVIGGEMGAPNLKHPPARVGAYSLGSTVAGESASGSTPSEGPMPRDGE